ncbi:hypothetical protein C8R42DRAFT_776185 [Lentinula raphanica]|nr:hypothetical protein C8R42DRAFT_776185 [Lentinula raphanica]
MFQSPQSWSPPTISLNTPCKRSTKTVYQQNLYCIQNLTHIVMTRPVHILPLGVLCVILASAISPEVLAAPTSFNNPGSLGTVVRARNGLKVDGHVSSCLSSAVAVAGAGASDGAVRSSMVTLYGGALLEASRGAQNSSMALRSLTLMRLVFMHMDKEVILVHKLLKLPSVLSTKPKQMQLTFTCRSILVRLNLRPVVIKLHLLDKGALLPRNLRIPFKSVFLLSSQVSFSSSFLNQLIFCGQGTRIFEIMREVEPLVKGRDLSQQQPPLPRQRARYEFCQREGIQRVPKLLAEVVQLAQSDKEPSPVKESARMIGEQLLDIVDVCKLHVNGVDEFKAIINPVQNTKQPQVSFSEGTRIDQIEEEVKSIVRRINPSQPPLERQRARYDFCQREEIQRVPDLLAEVILLSQSDKEPQHVRTKAISIGKDLIDLADHCKLQVNGLARFKAVVMSSEKSTHV